MKTTIIIILAAILALSLPMTGSAKAAQKNNGFKISTPALTIIKQGETKIVYAKLKRDDYFKQNVSFKIEKLDKGITVEPSEALVKANEKGEVPIKITATTKTNIGEYRVTVTGTSESGDTASDTFKVKVESP